MFVFVEIRYRIYCLDLVVTEILCFIILLFNLSLSYLKCFFFRLFCICNVFTVKRIRYNGYVKMFVFKYFFI